MLRLRSAAISINRTLAAKQLRFYSLSLERIRVGFSKDYRIHLLLEL